MRLANKLLPRIAFLTALAALAGAPLRAQSWCGNPVPPCDPTNPSSKCYQPPPPDPRCEPRECKKCTKSPCYVGSGVYVNSAVDLELPTPGFTISAARNYESTHTIDGPMGHGWNSSLTAHLYYATYFLGGPIFEYREANITMPDGARYRFVEDSPGRFSPPLGRHDTLVRNPDGSFDLTLQRTMSRFHFDAEGSIETMTDDYGNALRFRYDSGLLTRVEDLAGSGRYIDVYWGADGRISDLVDSAGRQINFTYDAQGLLSTSADPLGRFTNYSYTQGKFVPLLASVVDNWGRVLTSITFDTKDRVTTYTEKGETFTYIYSYLGNPSKTAKVDGAGNTWIYVYGGAGLVGDEVPPAGVDFLPRHTDYYADGTIQQVVDELGSRTFLTYDRYGNIASMTRFYGTPNAVRYDYDYDPTFPARVTAITPRNPTTGNVEPAWQAWRYSYHQVGSPAPGTPSQIYRVKSDGLTLESVATFEYDEKGRLVGFTDAAGATTNFVFDSAQNLTAVILPANNVAEVRPTTTFTYDAAGRVTGKTDPEGSLTSYLRDEAGRLTGISLPAPSPGSPIALSHSISYDEFESSSGLLFSTQTGPNGETTRLGKDQFGRTITAVNPLGATTRRDFTQGLLTGTTDSQGNVTHYSYDKLKRLSSITFPDLAAESYTYFADGALKSKLDRKNQLITYAYDYARRLTARSYPNGTGLSYGYTGSALSQVVDSTANPPETHVFAYDTSYRRSSESQASRGTISYSYLPGDRIGSYSVSGGPSASYSYFSDGSVRSIHWSLAKGGDFDFTYNLRGQYSEIGFPNGQMRRYFYDALGRVTRLENADPLDTTLAAYDYTYDISGLTGSADAVGFLTERAATVRAQGLDQAITRFTYDAAGQLTRVEYPEVTPFNGEVDQWTYDALGNRLTATADQASHSYSYGTAAGNPEGWNRLLSDGVNSYSYDLNGSVTSIARPQGTETFSWDYEGRSIARSGAGSTTSNTYDFLGRRTTTTRNGVSRTYLFRGDSPIRVGQGEPLDLLVGPLRGELLAIFQNDEVFYPLLDERDSVVALTDDSHSAVRRETLYDVWGAIRESGGDAQSFFGHLGREGDGADYWMNDARYYSPSIGRFLQEDPGGLDESTGKKWAMGLDAARPAPGGPPRRWEQADLASLLPEVNRTDRSYTYGRNNPVGFSDPGGRHWVPELVAFAFLSWEMIEAWKCNEEFDICFNVCTTHRCNFCRNPKQSGDPLGNCFQTCHTICRGETDCYWDVIWVPIKEIKTHWVLKWVPDKWLKWIPDIPGSH